MKQKTAQKICCILLTSFIMVGILQTAPLFAETIGGVWQAAAADVSGDFEFTVSGSVVTITKYIGSAAVVDIPETIDGMSVRTIGANAFQSCSGLTNVVIPLGVASIGNYAFYDCVNLTSVIIPDSVTSMGSSVFSNCYGLTSVTISNRVTSIGNYAFLRCYSLTSVAIPNGVTSIGLSAFLECSSLASITIPNSVMSIGNSAFSGCSNLKNITLSGSLTRIEDGVFRDSGLVSTNIPAGVSYIATSAFHGCLDLMSINVASDNPYFTSEDGVLYSKDKHTLLRYPGGKEGAFTIPFGVTSIGNYAFYTCNSLTSVIIPDGVISIGNYAFEYCESLTSITIPNSVTSIWSYAFSGCSSLKNIALPDGLTSIEDGLFSYSGLESINISAVILSINKYAFDGCSYLININVANDNPYFMSEDGVLYSKDKLTLLRYPGGREGAFTIPFGVEVIGAGSFFSCKLTSVVIPDFIRRISESAFEDCDSLISVIIQDGVPSIGDFAFSDCDSLASIIIPGSVISIGECAFSDCGALKDITILDGVTSIGDEAFSYCESLVSITIQDSVTFIERCAFYECVNLKNITLSNSLTSIEYYVFGYCGLESIYIPASVSHIDEFKFDGCRDMMSINVADDNPYFMSENGVLYNKDKSTLLCYPGGRAGEFTIPDGVEVIDIYAFASNDKLTRVVIPDSVNTIEVYAFNECNNLTEVRFQHMNALGSPDDFIWWFDDLSPDFKLIYLVGADGFTTPEWRGYPAYPAPGAPTVSAMTCNSVTLTANASYEYSTDGTTWQTSNVFSDLTALTSYTFYQRIAATSDESASVESLGLYTITPDHDWDDGVVTIEPTELEEGEIIFTCRNCDVTYTESIPALGHTHNYTAIVTAPTCTEQGYTTYTCSCGDSYIDDYVEALGHDFITVTVEPACEEAGSVTVTCSRCDYEDLTVIPALGHDWDDGAVTVEPTELEDGEMTFTCRRCGDTRTEIIPKTGKPILIVNGVEMASEIVDGVLRISPTQEQMTAILNAPGDTVVIDVRGTGCTDVDLLVAAAWFNNCDKTIEIITDLGSASIKTKNLWNNSGKTREIVVRNNSVQIKNN